jgi:hypothetical protein
MIDHEMLELMLINAPNFVGFLVAVYILNVRMRALECLLRDILEDCLPNASKTPQDARSKTFKR